MLNKLILLGGLIICFWGLPVFADESPTSTPDVEIPTSTPEIPEIPTSTLEVIIPTSTPTTTLEIIIPTTTPTSTPEIEIPTSTPTTTLEFITTTSTPTSTPEIEIPTSTPTTTLDTTTTTTTPTSTPENIGSGGGSTPEEQETISVSKIQETINKILDYLKSNQDETGKIIDGTVTDWAIISFGANGEYADNINEKGISLLEYEKKYNLDDPESDMNSCASYPRHILALLSAGVNPDDDAILGLKNKILNECYWNGNFGPEPNQTGINDDIFGLIALLTIGVDINENIITDTITDIIANQQVGGAFTWNGYAGADITGAVINALQYAKDKGVLVSDSVLTNAKNYLKTTQQTDGGWGYGSSDVMTTSWVLMGINSLGENQADWFTSEGKNPWHPLTEKLNEEGYYESAWVPGTADWFALKHAVPALAGKYWPIILDPIVENFSEGATFTYGGGSSYVEPEVTTTTPTTTLDIVIPTSTPITTLDIIIPTSTPTTTIDMVSSTPTTTLSSITKTTVVRKISPQGRDDNGSGRDDNEIASLRLAMTNEKQKNTTTMQTLSASKKRDSSAPQNDSGLEKIIDELPLDSPTRRTAKKALAVSGGGSVMLGLYLGLKFLKTIV